MIGIRARLRQAKRWDLADKVRSDLAGVGVALEDTSQGTVPKLRQRGNAEQNSPSSATEKKP